MRMLVSPPYEQWEVILQRPVASYEKQFPLVKEIFDTVKGKGDVALLEYTARFDKVSIEKITLSEDKIKRGADACEKSLQQAIETAYKNIYTFHHSQLHTELPVTISPGVVCWRKSIPISSVGLYVPGGSAPLFSTVLMLGVPALLAGCQHVSLCTPPTSDGLIHPAILFAASLCGIKTIHTIGGAQAIAALALGTESIKKASKIFGPGNSYVTAAKQYAMTVGTAIDMPAGPSELAIYADQSAQPSFVAADLLSQLEHGEDSHVLLICSHPSLAASISSEMMTMIDRLPRREIVLKSIAHSVCIVEEKVETAFELINEYAPEHLIIASDQATELEAKVINAGSVFLGQYTPESAGDYASGTNHTLPTSGWAKSYSGVSVDSFLRKTTFQQLTSEGLAGLSETIISMAEAEGLHAHAEAVKMRLKK